MTRTAIKMATTIIAEIHSGDRTHHHDQSILPMSFSVMNTIASRPAKPMPDELDLVSAIIC